MLHGVRIPPAGLLAGGIKAGCVRLWKTEVNN